MSEEKTLGEVYEDRNVLVLALSEMVQKYRHALMASGEPAREFRACWTEDDGDDADADEWAIVYVWLPTGQASWHVPRELVEESTIPHMNVEWDGHTRQEKNERLLRFSTPSA